MDNRSAHGLKEDNVKAVCWNGVKDVRVETVDDPIIMNPRDAIIKVTSTAICGSDLHLYNGAIPMMQPGDILGHEFMGEVVEVGKDIKTLQRGDRVVVPFPIACGSCFFCTHDLWSLCDNTNPNKLVAEKMFGYSPAGIFGYSHLVGGYAGGQAEYVRVPFADVGPIKVSDDLSDDEVLFLSDILPTGYMAAEYCNIQPGDTVAVWGCGPVGQLAMLCARNMGAGRVIAIDGVPERLSLAQSQEGVEVLDYQKVNVVEALRDMTAGRGPDSCIDAVGMEAHGATLDAAYDRIKHAVRMETDRPHVLREIILACRKGGTLSVAGVYAGVADKIPVGALMNKGLTIRTGQTPVHKYLKPLLGMIQREELDPSFIITHRLPLSEAPHAYKIFNEKEDNCIKVVFKL